MRTVKIHNNFDTTTFVIKIKWGLEYFLGGKYLPPPFKLNGRSLWRNSFCPIFVKP